MENIDYLKEIKLSYYSNVKDTKGTIESLAYIVDRIKNKQNNLIKQIRELNDKPSINILKRQLEGFTVSGIFKTRKSKNLIKHSGLIQIDIDEISDLILKREILINDPYSFVCFISPSGKGLKLIVKIDIANNDHLNCFNGLALYYKSKYGITIDPCTKDVSRLCFISHDAKIFVNANSETFIPPKLDVNERLTINLPVNKSFKGKTTVNQSINHVYESFIAKIVEIEKLNIDITNSYNDWLKLGFAICDEFGESGRSYFHRISSLSDKYDLAKCNTQYDNCLKSNGSGITIKTFFHHVENVLQENKKKDEPKTIFHITEAYLNKKYDLRRNTIKLEIELKSKKDENWNTCNDANLYIELNKNGINISETKLSAILRSNMIEDYNPILQYFKNLKVWNKTEQDYISKLISYIETFDNKDSSELKYNFKKWIVRCVKCAIQNDYFNKQAFILVHKKQNSGKSTFCRFLCPPTLSEFSRDELPNGKDAKIALTNNFLINLDELANLNKRDVDQLKSTFSIAQVKERLPYDRKPSNLPRIANFIGSTNNTEFLSDPTGSVRWLCFEIKNINWNYKKEINIDDVWRQAYTLSLDKTFNCEFTEEDIKANENRNEKFQLVSSEQELLEKYFEYGSLVEKIDSNFYTTSDIVSYLSDLTTGINLSPIRMGKVISKLGIEKIQHSKGIGRGYYLKKK